MRICITCDGISDTAAAACDHCGTPLLSTLEVHFPVRRGEADASHPLLGRTIGGKYLLQGVLGKGGMGTVFRAVHEVSFVPVALKLLHKRLATRPEYRSWFLAEARKAGRVMHENSARVQDVGEAEDGTVFLAMELAAGLPLSAWLSSGSRMAPGVLVDIMSQIVRALEAAHEVGVVHRDLSPRNIAISIRDGEPFVKVLDFGIARGMPNEVAQRDGGEGSDAGAPPGYANPAYAAPEHLAGEESDARADLYSLGVIAFHALTGRLPIQGSNGRELAAATLAGRVERLRAGSGVPVRLARLVNALLEFEPSMRPASASAVGAELRRIGEAGQARGLRATAAIVLMVAVALSAAAFVEPLPSYLLAQSGSPLVLAATPDLARKQELRSQDLAELRFEFQGFAPRALELQVSRDGRIVDSLALNPTVDGATLSISASVDEQAWIVPRLAGHSAVGSGELDLEFRVAGLPPLAYARLRVDDTAPEIDLQHDGTTDEAALNGKARLTIEAVDVGTIRRTELVVFVAGESPQRFPVDSGNYDVLELLGDAFPGVGDYGAIDLHVECVDVAGNVARSDVLGWSHFDLRAPDIVSAPTVIPYDGGGASVRLRLDDAEPDLDVSVRGPDGAVLRLRDAEPLGDKIDFVLVPGDTDPPFQNGTYRVRLEDKWGNDSEQFAEVWRFEVRDSNVVFAIRDGRAAVWDGLYLADGGEVVLGMQCNPLYRPRRGVATDSVGAARAVAIEPGDDGEWRLRVPALPDGRHEIAVQLEPVGEVENVDGPSVRPLSFLVSSATPSLRLPKLPDTRFLRQFVDGAVLRSEANGVSVSEGVAWDWRVPDVRMLRGSVWVGNPEFLEALEVTPPITADGDVVRAIEVRQGMNTIGVELVDPLGRTVEVWVGDEPAAMCAGGDGHRVQRVAEFFYHPQPCATLEPVIRVEHGQPTAFTVRCAIPFDSAAGIALQVGRERLSPRSFAVSEDGAEARLEFNATFEQVSAAAGLTTMPEEEFRGSGRFEVEVRLETPAGDFEFALPMQPVRSSLAPVRLGELFDTSIEGLESIVMVPSLGPGPVFVDPVPSDSSVRGSFRPLPVQDVRNVGVVFLQHAELTRAQYDVIVRRGLVRVSATPAQQWRRFVHAADPLGAERLTAAELLPSFREGSVSWADGRAAGPNRPVTGIDYFQCYTVVRLLGFLIAGDPALLRLPLGVELEAAALGERGGDTRLNGTRRCRRKAFESATNFLDDPTRWPPTVERSREVGDVVRTELGFELVGLDFGVREWVADLPFSFGVDGEPLLREWLSDHERHLQRAEQFALGQLPSSAQALQSFFARIGAVRGLANGEVAGLIDGISGREIASGEYLSPRVPGVTRCQNLRRDGREPSSRDRDATLAFVGMRLAGGARFVDKVRAR